MPILSIPIKWQMGETPNVESTEIPNNIKGNYQTVSAMKSVAVKRSGDPRVRQMAVMILNNYNVKSHNYRDESIAVGDFVKKNMAYVRDPRGIEQLQDPVKMVNDIVNGVARGDCDDMSLLIVTLLLSIGHDPRLRAIRYSPRGPFNHIYVVDYERNGFEKPRRIVLDAIMKHAPIGYEIPHQFGEEFEV